MTLEAIVCIDPGEFVVSGNELFTNKFHPELGENFD
jgi:hypothetical protein